MSISTLGFQRAALSLAVLICLPLYLSCSGAASGTKKSTAPGPGTEANSIVISTAIAKSRKVALHIDATGSFVAEESSDVAPQSAGRVVETPVSVGSSVKKGQVIARLDNSDALLKLQQAKASVEQTQAAVRQAQAKIGFNSGTFNPENVPEVQSALASYQSAQAEVKLAEADAKRYSNLVKTGDVSQSNYEQQQTQAETAKAKANAAHRQYETALNTARQNYQGIASAQGSLAAVQAQLDQAQKAVDDTVIRAPIQGQVSDRPIAVGEYVALNSKIATIVRIKPIKLELQVAEAGSGQIKVSMPVTATVDSAAGQFFEGRVTAINPAIDPSSRALTVEATFPNQDERLKPGMFSSAEVILPGTKEVVTVPRSAVLVDPNTQSAQVFVVEDGKARVRVVRVGESMKDAVQILSGVPDGATVSTSDLRQLFDGAIVSMKK